MSTDEYSGKYTLVKKHVRETLAADAWLATDSGTRLAIATFPEEAKANENEFGAHELPSLQVETLPEDGGSSTGGEGDEDTLGLIRNSVGFIVIVTVKMASRSARIDLCSDILARGERVLLNQFGENQMNDLDTVLPGCDPGTVVTHISGPIIEDSGQNEDGATSDLCVGAITGRIEYDEAFGLS